MPSGKPARFRAPEWGMVAPGLGLGVEAVFPYDFEDPIACGVLLILGGAALMLHCASVRSVEDGADGRRDR